MKTKLSSRFWVALTLFSLIGQVAWVVENMYFNVFIYKMFHASAAQISAMVAASSVAATVTTLLMGALSDRVGKRKIFICGGYLVWGVSILSFCLLRTDIIEDIFPMTANAMALGVNLVIIMDCVMTFFGSTANDAAFNAWVTDSTDHTNRGAVEGINSMMPLVAILVVFGGFMAFNLDKAQSWTAIFAIIGGVVMAVGIAGIFLIRDPAIKPTRSGYLENLLYGFRPSTVKVNKKLYLMLLIFSLFNISIQVYMPYLILYYEVSLGMANYVLIMAPAIIVAAAVTAFWGKVYDSRGFQFACLVALASLMGGYVLLYLFRGTFLVFVGSLFMMCGYLSGMAVFGAYVRDYTPEGKAGRFQGLRIFSQVLIPGVIGPGIGAWILRDADMVTNSDGTTSFIPNADIFLGALIVAVAVTALVAIFKGRKPPRTVQLETPWMDQPEIPWNEYPRPQLKRNSFLCLNGKWELKCNGESWGDILVPYPPESALSGVGRRVEPGDLLTYERSFTLPEGFRKDRVILHLGAVDQLCRVFVNDQEVGTHEGGYLPFSWDITDVLQEVNTLRVEVRDDLDHDLPYGKQRVDRGGMWYTPVSGIWQTVWAESVPEHYVQALKITQTMDSATIEITGGSGEMYINCGGRRYAVTGNAVTIRPENPRRWTPEDPYLYEFTLITPEERVESYFALRTIDRRQVGEYSRLCLNGEPYFFHGLLDQGYYPDGIFLPGSPEGFTWDVAKMKELGFNTLRKHIKVEPERFYYDCDRLGMVVFQDLVNSGGYYYVRDTVLPTVGFKKHSMHPAPTERRAEFFKAHARGIIDHLHNHPCVLFYTLFNEGWGQHDTQNLYELMKQWEPNRIWNASSGWFKESDSDVQSEHIYFGELKMTANQGKPLTLTEFGGYSWPVEGHRFNLDEEYGYQKYTNSADLQAALTRLYREDIIPQVATGLCAAILTQVSDVEDETNGLVTYDRQVVKVDAAEMSAIGEALRRAVKA